MTVGHKLALHTDLFSQAQLDAIYASESLPTLVHRLEAAPVAANAPRMPVGGLVGALASMFKSAYVYYWFQDTWYEYARDEVKLMDLNFPKAACDALAWGTSTAWSCYRMSVAGEKEGFAAVANSLLLVCSYFNRVKDGVELFHIYADKNPARELTESLRNWEAMTAGAAVLVGDALFAVGLATIPNPDCPEDLWDSMIAMPVIAWADSAVYSLLALEYGITDPARRLQVRQARTVLNVLRPVLGFANAALKIGTGAAGYSYPGSATD